MLNETQQKISLYNRADYLLSDDSLNDEVINLEFQSIDNHLFNRLKNIHLKQSKNSIISRLQHNNIILGSVR